MQKPFSAMLGNRCNNKGENSVCKSSNKLKRTFIPPVRGADKLLWREMFEDFKWICTVSPELFLSALDMHMSFRRD